MIVDSVLNEGSNPSSRSRELSSSASAASISPSAFCTSTCTVSSGSATSEDTVHVEVHGVLRVGHLGGGLNGESDDLLQRFRASAHPSERNDDSGVEAEHGNDLQGPAQQR